MSPPRMVVAPHEIIINVHAGQERGHERPPDLPGAYASACHDRIDPSEVWIGLLERHDPLVGQRLVHG